MLVRITKFAFLSIGIGFVAAMIIWFVSERPQIVQDVKKNQIFYYPPEFQPNCVNEFGCRIKKPRLPDWLEKEIALEKQAQARAISKHEAAAFNSQLSGVITTFSLFGLLISGPILLNAWPRIREYLHKRYLRFRSRLAALNPFRHTKMTDQA